MNALPKKIEFVANVSIIIVAILLGVVLVRTYLLPRATTPQKSNTGAVIANGTRLTIPGVDWKANQRTLVLALSTQCHFCSESAPFYQRLVQERAKLGHVRLVAVLPQPIDESQKYLKSLGVDVDDLKQLRLDAIGVSGTPTLIIADTQGVVTDSWRGKLPADKETEVLNLLNK